MPRSKIVSKSKSIKENKKKSPILKTKKPSVKIKTKVKEVNKGSKKSAQKKVLTPRVAKSSFSSEFQDLPKKAKTVPVDIISDDLSPIAAAVPNSKPITSFDPRSDFSYPDFKEETAAPEINDLDIDSEDGEEASVKESLLTPIDEIDNQKKFFADLNSEIVSRQKGFTATGDLKNEEKQLLDLFEEDGKEGGGAKKTDRPRIGLYRRFVWRFVFVVAFLALLVLYISFSKLTINIVPKGEALNESLLLKVSSATSSPDSLVDPREALSGEVEEIPIVVEKTFSASGEEFASETISGRVKIINNYNKNQALVATTRILSPDNKLFRIKDAVNVPAGGEVWADIYVEKPSRDLAINPTTFTIPGLWAGLQDKIYAKSETAFVFAEDNTKYVKASDISLAEKEIGDEFSTKMTAEIETARKAANVDGRSEKVAVYLPEQAMSISDGAKIDDRVASFSAKASGTVRVVFFSKAEVEKLALNKLNLLIPDGKKLLEFDPNNIVYSFESYDEESGAATIKVTFSGKMVLKGGEEVFDKASLVNLNSEQIKTYLRDQPDVNSFELKFYPSFVKRAPRLVDRIQINLLSE
jgi:hypothetical protein